jgi:hypothetical protein
MISLRYAFPQVQTILAIPAQSPSPKSNFRHFPHIMTPSTGLLSLLLLCIISGVRGQLTVQSDWVFPQSPDYSTVLSIGSTVYFQWTSNLQNEFAAYLPNGNVSHVDVWVTGQTISDGYHKLAGLFKHPRKHQGSEPD